MNQLSWLIYAASFCDGINNAAAALVFGSCVGIVVCLVVMFANRDEADEYFQAVKDHARYPTMYPKPSREDYPIPVSVKSVAGRYIKRFIIVSCSSLVVSIVVPSKETVYAIAASEMGEELLKTPTATKAVKALDAWLDKQIKTQP